MARIPEEVIERLKQEVSLERLVAARGIELKRHGKDLVGLCPFHEDHSPSLVVTPAKNVWNCLGACQQGGDVIQWVMKAQGISFRHAVELLRADHPSLSEAAAPVRISTVRKLEPTAAIVYRASVISPGDLGRDATFGFFDGYLTQTPGYQIPQDDDFFHSQPFSEILKDWDG
jgi:hypothetical protein